MNHHRNLADLLTVHRSTRSSVRRGAVAASMAVTAVLAAACGSSSSSPSSTTVPATATASSVQLSTTTIAHLGTVVVGPNGRTLYFLTSDAPTKTTCSGACAALWPPLVEPSGSKVVLAHGLTGSLGSLTRPDGTTQVTFDQHPLYTYSQDTAPGQANGQGVDGTWFVLKASSTTGTTVPSTTQGGGGY